MSAELYPHLYAMYEAKYKIKLGERYEDKKNIDEIVAVIKEHFSDLFNLDILEYQISEGNQGSYVQLFERCLGRLIDLSNPRNEKILRGPSQIISELHRFFHEEDNRDEWLLCYTMVPKVGENKQRQIGFLEKMATGQLRYAEPLSFLDMHRVTRGMKKLIDEDFHRDWNKDIAVLHLAHLEHLDGPVIDALKQKEALIVNFNPNLKEAPQWGVLDLKSQAYPRVFCEVPIIDTAKQQLEDKLQVQNCTYEGATANSLQTTGYTAATWLDANIVKAWQCDTEGDFANLLFDTTLLMVSADSNPLKYRYLPEEEALFSEAFQYLKGLDPNFDRFPNTLIITLQACALAEHQGERFSSGDLPALMKVLYEKKTSKNALESKRDEATRTFIVGFAKTLEQRNILRQEKDAATNKVLKTILHVPNFVNVDDLKEAHIAAARAQKVNPHWLMRLLYKDTGGLFGSVGVLKDNAQEEAVRFMLYTLIRVKAKSPILDITLPADLAIPPADIDTMVRLLDQNAFVTEVKNPRDHGDLETIKKRTAPTLARNRWLHTCEYLPPIADDYWKRAAEYWLTHLVEAPDVLLPKGEHEAFKTCVREMGQRGLEAVLERLCDEPYQERLGNLYGLRKPPFYLGCADEHAYDDCLNTFLGHLARKQHFPFGEIGIAYHAGGHDGRLVDVLKQLNSRHDFEQVTLTNCLDTPVQFGAFLDHLIREAKTSAWQGLVIIPELQGNQVNTEEERVLRNKYALLNDIILQNKRHRKSRIALDKIEASTTFVDESAPVPVNGVSSSSLSASGAEESKASELEDEGDASALMQRIGDLDEEKSWPFQKGGVVQLQLQQQQEINQSRQIQQEKQRVVHQIAEAALNGQLVDYNNIEDVLGDFWDAFKDENSYHLDAARLKRDYESELQGFFHTFINANPHVGDATHVIQKMTPLAAKMLLRHHRHLSSGLNPDNLPKGFFTQRAKDGKLVLLYDPELAYLSLPTPFTLDFSGRPLPGDAWEGSFRQLNLSHYIDEGATTKALGGDIWTDILLFAKLQPVKTLTEYEEDYNAFVTTQSYFSVGNTTANKDKIIENWPVFYQCWKYAGDAGVSQFLAKSTGEFNFRSDDMARVLFRKQDADLNVWIQNNAQFNEHELQAMGQIYYKFGDEGLTCALRKLKELNDALGEEFFTAFRTSFLAHTDNFNVLMSERCVQALDDMIAKLGPDAATGKKRAFMDVMRLHIASVDWEPIERLWGGFECFENEVNQLSGLELQGDEFKHIAPENMLVCMNRISDSLEHLAGDAQGWLLRNLQVMDLTHGGVHHAIQKEGFQNFHSALRLREFHNGKPTYAADLKGLYEPAFDLLQMQRALAASSKFKPEAFNALLPHFAACDGASKDNLMWLLNTNYTILNDDVGAVLEQIKVVSSNIKSVIAKHLQHAVYERGHRHLAISLDAILAVIPFVGHHADLAGLLNKHPNGTVLEALTLLHETNRLIGENAAALFGLFQADLVKPVNCSEVLACQAYKLAVLFNATGPDWMQQFYDKTRDLEPVVKQELTLLMTQLLSTDCTTSHLPSLTPDKFRDLLRCMDAMQKAPARTSAIRIALLDKFEGEPHHIKFKYSKSGAFRTVRDDEKPIAELKIFTDHQTRLWQFIQNHIVVPSEGDTKEKLGPILRFLKRLQLNRTYLNEVEPLLASLEKTSEGLFWTADYFSGLLQALQPENDAISFPISLLKVILEEKAIAAKDINEVQTVFPDDLVAPFQTILKATEFDRNQQALLCRIALRAFEERGVVTLLNDVMSLLSNEVYENSRSYALAMLVKSPNMDKLEQQFLNCRWLLQHANTAELKPHWNKVGALWLKALSGDKNEQALFDTIKGQYEEEPDKQALILHIIAYASLREGLNDTDTHAYELHTKAPKLLQKLGLMPLAELELLAACYPNQPSPGTDDIRRLLKKQHTEGVSWKVCLDDFACAPYPEPRVDYAGISLTRDADLQRMIAETRISAEKQKQPFSASTSANLTLVFMYLKSLESGEYGIEGSDKPIKAMSPEALAEAFKTLSEQLQHAPNDILLQAQVWAVLFEVLGRTTRKYPHLAQQFALIANDMGVDASTRVLQLATGEGKSHFVAMRAARHVGQGKKVDICTAKRTLATRDLEDYQDFFDYLGLKTACIDSKLMTLSRKEPETACETYVSADICYSTVGDLSLFLDGQTYAGYSIDHNPETHVGLFDEFDFIRFEEGRKTEYNYARPTGKTPKQMTWFYQALNRFYKENKFSGEKGQDGNPDIPRKAHITQEILKACYDFLERAAEGNEEREVMLPQLIREPMQLVQWLQSAREAHDLERGSGFTVRELNISVGDEMYPMREVIPVSSDNQPMTDSTFSAGVHQLLAVRLNTEAELKDQPQNFHIHPESNIISSQVASRLMKTLWKVWEGFSGTITAAQAKVLNDDHDTQVLHVPTNQRDLRCWHKPEFYSDKLEREKQVVQQIRVCLAKKQSILFACKDDKHVKALEEVLKKHLTPAELEQFIVYTNEEARTASEVLDDKKAKEAWSGGKKHQAIGLVASGFGRGDNVAVEAVFLFGVNDSSDKLQKGGRTARNGAEGEVFQFYLNEDLIKEEEELMEWVRASAVTQRDADDDDDEEESVSSAQSITSIQENLDAVVADTPEEACFERLMLLREYIFSVQNSANQGCRDVVAEFSAWGMRCLGQIKDPGKRTEFTTLYSSHLKCLEKTWIDILSLVELDTNQKIEKIRKVVSDLEHGIANAFLNDLTTGLKKADAIHVVAFEFLEEYKEVHVELVVPLPPRKPTPEEKASAIICGAMARLTGNMAHPALGNVPKMLEALETLHHDKCQRLVDALSSEDNEEEEGDNHSSLFVFGGGRRFTAATLTPEQRQEQTARIWTKPNTKLLQLAEEVAECKTFDNFVDALRRCVRQARAPSSHDDVLEGATRGIAPGDLLNDVQNPALRDAYQKIMKRFEPMLQTEITEALRAPLVRGDNAQYRIEQAMPLLNYLAQFDKVQQERWGEGYVRELIGPLLEEAHTNVLALHLNGVGHDAPVPMGYSHFHALWQMAKTIEGDVPFNDLFALLEHAVKNDPENRMRMLTKWEAWAKDLPEVDKQAFLVSFCKTMSQFEEGRNWDVFVGLVDKTQTWWNKFGKDAYRADIVALWKQLEDAGDALGTLTDFMNLGVKPPARLDAVSEDEALVGIFGGKSWFQLLRLGFQQLNKGRLADHGIQLGKLWVVLDVSDQKKITRTERFFECCEGLNHTYALIETFREEASETTCKEQLLRLDGARFENLTRFVYEQHAFLKDNLQVLAFALDYLSDARIPIARAERTRYVLIDWSKDASLDENNQIQLIRTLNTVRPQLFTDLSDVAFEKVMGLTEAHKTLFAEYPELHEKMFEYSLDKTITPHCFDHLVELLLDAGRFHTLHPEISTTHLMAGIDRFKNKPEIVLVALRDLFADKVSEQPLFDDAAEYLADDKREASRADVLGVMKLFYATRARARTNTIGMLAVPDVYECFRFTADDTSKVRDKRVTWMHLLDQGVFVEEMVKGEASVSHRWNDDKNNVLLDASYGRYTAHTNAILKEPSAKPSLGKVRDLTARQQTRLLTLTDEFQVIGERYARPLRSAKGVEEQVNTLKASLAKFSSAYSNSWFKSAERITQFQGLNKKLDTCLSGLSKTDQKASLPYELLLKEICEARQSAMRSDLQVNEKRGFFKRMNLSGRSRYFNTLNQMQDAILRHWTQDLDAVQQFNVYKVHHSEEFKSIFGYLNTALSDHVNALGRIGVTDANYDSWFNRIGRFFGFLTDERAVDDLKKTVDAFGVIQDGVNQADAVGTLRSDLETVASRLPGHLTTLVNELLVRGNALESSLSSQPEYDDIRQTLS